jgi:hypothetical protein
MSKYRQRGYMESDREPAATTQSKPQSKPQDREGPRSPRMMAFGETSKCTRAAPGSAEHRRREHLFKVQR